MERDKEKNMSKSLHIHFNSHAHVERDYSQIEYVKSATNFNSHAHVERDSIVAITFTKMAAISTHTLTWSVTI